MGSRLHRCQVIAPADMAFVGLEGKFVVLQVKERLHDSSGYAAVGFLFAADARW